MPEYHPNQYSRLPSPHQLSQQQNYGDVIITMVPPQLSSLPPTLTEILANHKDYEKGRKSLPWDSLYSGFHEYYRLHTEMIAAIHQAGEHNSHQPHHHHHHHHHHHSELYRRHEHLATTRLVLCANLRELTKPNVNAPPPVLRRDLGQLEALRAIRDTTRDISLKPLYLTRDRDRTASHRYKHHVMAAVDTYTVVRYLFRDEQPEQYWTRTRYAEWKKNCERLVRDYEYYCGKYESRIEAEQGRRPPTVIQYDLDSDTQGFECDTGVVVDESFGDCAFCHGIGRSVRAMMRDIMEATGIALHVQPQQSTSRSRSDVDSEEVEHDVVTPPQVPLSLQHGSRFKEKLD